MANNEPDFENMTDAEIADWQYAHRDELDEDLENAEEVEVEVVKPLSVTTSFRMSTDEASTLREAVRKSGLTQSEWIRQVCLLAAGAQSPVGTTSEQGANVLVVPVPQRDLKATPLLLGQEPLKKSQSAG
ncbi:plasmid mobilization protein [Saccharopolyspora hattusasensis]|uniref:plasmid mobilization protein n=1 Tax=Saccharopolyspora hattusasensis TaxID=1128679 RepID=UPI003D9897F4